MEKKGNPGKGLKETLRLRPRIKLVQKLQLRLRLLKNYRLMKGNFRVKLLCLPERHGTFLKTILILIFFTLKYFLL